MRWLLLKDVQILRRSPLLVSLLVIYPIAIALLIGLALSRAPAKPKVAFLNEVPASQATVTLGNDKIDFSKYASQFFGSVAPITVQSRSQALAKIRNGDALAALIIPADTAQRLSSGVQSAQIEVIFNGDALKQSYVETTITAQLAKANQSLAQQLTMVAVSDLGLLFNGGRIATPLGSLDLLGLNKAVPIINAAVAKLPPGSSERTQLQRVGRFAGLAGGTLGLAKAGLSTVSMPVQVKRTVIGGKRAPLDGFAVAVAATLSLMFVCVLLAAGMLALEREENAYGRLVRGLVSRGALLAEKIGLAAACSLVVSLVMLTGIAAFVGLDFARFGHWTVALAAGALAFGALGVAIGALAREVRAASLLAFLLSLPIAFLALVPSGAVASGIYDVIRVVSFCFPFKAALQAVDAAINETGGFAGALVHLLGLTAAFALIARVALRRFA